MYSFEIRYQEIYIYLLYTPLLYNSFSNLQEKKRKEKTHFQSKEVLMT